MLHNTTYVRRLSETPVTERVYGLITAGLNPYWSAAANAVAERNPGNLSPAALAAKLDGHQVVDGPIDRWGLGFG